MLDTSVDKFTSGRESEVIISSIEGNDCDMDRFDESAIASAVFVLTSPFEISHSS
jgi:hypothetical protein